MKIMKKKKILLSFLVILFSITTSKGQNKMVIHLVGSNNVTVAMKDIRRIEFQDNNMLLKTISGTENSYPLDDISLITFETKPSVICEMPNAENIEVHFYLNSNGEIIVETQAEIRMLTVFDLTGKVMTSARQNSISVASLSMGTYLLKVETNKGTVTKKFVKNR